MKMVRIWDASTRLFHWGLATSIAVSIYSGFQDKFDIWADVHLWSGYVVLGLVAWRILWGLVGSETNLFVKMLRAPAAVLQYLKEPKTQKPYNWVGHNPLGGYAVVFTLLLILSQAALGLFASDDMFFSGPLSLYRDILPFSPTGLHETLGYLVMGFAALHIVTIIAYRLFKKVNLVGAMITGKRQMDDSVPDTKMRPAWAGLISLIICVALVFALLG